MANVDPSKGSSSQSSEETKKDTLEIHVKTLDSQIYTFRVENDMRISQLKEKIASATSVPIWQQRLIFRGRVLKNDRALSEYHLENGHTLHLVVRQPTQTQTQNQSGTNSSQASNQNGNRGSDVGEGTQRTRIGHSVVVGLNVTEQGEGVAADISRIVGAVLNSIGSGIANNTLGAGNSPSTVTSTPLPQTSQGVQTGGQATTGGFQTGNQPQNILTSPLLHQMAIPDSLTTLNAYMTRMERILPLYTGNAMLSQAPLEENINQSASTYPNIDALITVIDRAERLLSGPGAVTLRHLAECLERERMSSELAVRSQVQTEAMHVGTTLQHLGSLLLELGRTISTVRMGEPPAEPLVISGPAVYINASGPNPLMVQPNSQNHTPIFGIPSLAPLANIGVPDPVLGDPPRNINIHVHSANSAAAGMPVGSAANVGDVAHGQPASHVLPVINIATQGESGAAQVLPAGAVIAAIPAHSHSVTLAVPSAGSSIQAPVLGSSPPVTGNMPHAAILSVEGLRLSGSNLQVLGNRSQGGHGRVVSQSASVSTDASMPAASAAAASSNAVSGPSSHVMQQAGDARDMLSSTSEVPKVISSRIGEQSIDIPVLHGRSDGTATDGGAPGERQGEERVLIPSSIDGKHHSDGHAVQSGDNGSICASGSNTSTETAGDSGSSHVSGSNASSETGGTIPLGLGLGGLQPMRRVKRMASRGDSAVDSAGSSAAENEALIAKGQEVLESLVSQNPRQKQGISFTSQGSTQQVGDRGANLGGAFSGMLQRMVPAVSQMLGTNQSTGSRNLRNNGGTASNTTYNQVDLQDALQRISQQDSPGNIFRAVLESAGRFHGEHDSNRLIEVLENDEELASEFVQMLHRHLHERLQQGSGSGSQLS